MVAYIIIVYHAGACIADTGVLLGELHSMGRAEQYWNACAHGITIANSNERLPQTER